MRKFPIPASIQQFADRFTNAGHSLYIVGGAVRDHYLGRRTSDYDFATDARPEQVIRLFRSVIPTGIKHGTVTVLYKGCSHEVTTFRTDGTYQDNRHPDQVTFVGDLADDLRRRDFTINALAVNAVDGTLVDLHHGIEDLRARKIRAIGEPEERFCEDALRIMRACRFASQLGFTIDEVTMDAMRRTSHRLTSVSGERVRAELFKILESERPSVGILAMHGCKALAILFSELVEGDNVGQKGNHQLDVLMHGIAACDAAPRSKPLVRLAALLHDIGKSRTKAIGPDGETTFHQHERHSELMAKDILLRLRCSNEETARVLNLIRNHMFNYSAEWTDGAVRRFINRVGVESIIDLFDLRRADRWAIDGNERFDDLVEFSDRIERVLAQESAMTIQDLVVDGNDLAGIGIPRGPLMGEILRLLLDTVLEDPAQNTPERLAIIARNLYEQRMVNDHSPMSDS